MFKYADVYGVFGGMTTKTSTVLDVPEQESFGAGEGVDVKPTAPINAYNITMAVVALIIVAVISHMA